MRRFGGLLCVGTVLPVFIVGIAHAQDGIWTGPGTEWTTGANWSSSPTVPDNNAAFINNGAPRSITISNDASVNTLTFDSAAPAYSFAVGNGATFTLGGLNNNSTFDPAFQVSGGSTFAIGDGAGIVIGSLADGSGGGTVVLGASDPGTFLYIAGDATTRFSGSFAGAGSLELDNGANLILTGSTNFGTIGGDLELCSCSAGGLTIDGGALTVRGQSEGVTIFGGTLSVINGGTLQIGPAAGTNADLAVGGGDLDIAGAGSSVTVTGYTGVGIFAHGGISISSGGTLNSQSGAEIDALFGAATVAVTGAGSTWNVGGPGLYVGGGSTDGIGKLTISNGGVVNVTAGGVAIGDAIDGSSVLRVSGAGATLNVTAGTLKIGATSCGCGLVGALIVDDGGTVNAAATTIDPGSGLRLGTGGLAGALVTPTIANNGEIVANFTDTLTLAADISGTGTLRKAGMGTLILSGNNSYTGDTTVAGGRLTVNGTITSEVTVDAGASFGGTGTVVGNVTNNGIVRPDIGTLNVTGTYTQNAGGTYQVELTPSGQSDRIAVTGNAVLNGTVAILPDSGSYTRNTTYTILTATGGRSGTFAGITGGNFAFLTPSLSYDLNDVFLTLLLADNAFANGSRTGNQYAVGTVLDQASAGATGDFATVLNALSGLDTVQGPQALNTISGQPVANFGSFNTQTASALMAVLGSQLGALHGGAGGGTHVAMAGPIDDQACTFVCDVAQPSRYGTWISGVAGLGSVAGNSNAGTFTYNFGGTAVGADYRLRPDLLVGLGAGYVSGTQWTDGFNGRGTTDAFSGSLYASYTPGPLYIDGLVGYAYAIDRLTRTISISGLQPRTAQASTGANQFMGQIETGYKLAVPVPATASITPFFRLAGSTTRQNGFTESGAQSLDLTVAPQTTNSLRTTLGADLAAEIRKVAVDLRLGWQHENADTARPMTASFAGAPGQAFTVYGATPQRDSAVLGLAARTHVADATELYARYDGEVGGGSDNHAFTAGLKMMW
jgi:outer membrane autotransporter protein